jgi:tripartite-type tricarboxylate transporter receptor subunit TctC
MKRIGVWFLGVVAALAWGARGTAEAAEFYAGKTIEVTVPFKEGGGSDVWIRVLAPYLQKHIAGNPRILVRNVPGGEAIHGMNQYALRAKADGLNLVTTSATNYFHALLGVKAVQYDFAKFKPLVVNAVGGAIYAAPALGVRAASELPNVKGKLVYAGISATALDLVPILAFELLGLEVKTVLGYEGRGAGRLAFERGESNIDYQTTPAYLASVVPLIKEGKALPLMSFGLVTESGDVVRDPALPDLPTVEEAYEKIYGKKPAGALWEAYKAFNMAGFSVQKILWNKAESPADSIKAVLEAVDRLQKDAEFQEKAKKVLGGYPVLRGDKLEPAIQRAFRLPPTAHTFVRDFLEKKFSVSLK